jgi:TPR repeat protein
MNYFRRRRRGVVTSLLMNGALSVMIGAACTAWAVNTDIPQIKAAAEKGSVQEEVQLGAAYFMGRGVERDDKQAAYWYTKAANSGDPEAQRQIGYFYMAGIGVDRDPSRGVRWFERAVAGGLVSAKVNLGVAYLWGLGVREDDSLAAKYFQEAAAKGSGPGASFMGTLCVYGRGVPKDMAEARRWFELGSKLHDARSELNLALMLSAEQSRSSKERAAKLLRESAKAGFVSARHQLGLFLLINPDLAKSPGEAMAVLESAEQAGLWKSSVVLGVLARDGHGIPRDPAAAYYHFRIALLRGGDEATKLLASGMNTLAAELPHTQVERLDAAAAEWSKNHPVQLEYVFENGEDQSDFPAFALASPEKDIHAGRLLTSPIDLGRKDSARSMP